MNSIIENNIENSELHYWVEVSGAIEQYFKKHNGYPIHNKLASNILDINASELTLLNDFVHYERPIGTNNELFVKMLFGIENKVQFQTIIQDIEKYNSLKKDIQYINDNVENCTIKDVIFIIENIYRAHEEDGFNELIPSWHEALMNCLIVLKNTPDKNQTILDYIQYAEYLIDDMQLLELHNL